MLVTGYVIGFIDARGSFSVSIKVQKDLICGVNIVDNVNEFVEKLIPPIGKH